MLAIFCLNKFCRTSAQAENVFLLCMSKGGYSSGGVQGTSSSSQSGGSGKNNSSEELGNTRKKELYEACRVSQPISGDTHFDPFFPLGAPQLSNL